MRVLLLSNLANNSGNRTTAERIASHLRSEGNEVTLQKPLATTEELNAFVRSHGPFNVILGLHAYRSGLCLVQSCLPYAVIIGGTDVNTTKFTKSQHRLCVMQQAVAGASYVVCFSDELQSITQSVLAPVDISKKTRIIPQGILLPPLTTLTPHVLDSIVPRFHDRHVFLLAAGLRPVKDVLFAVQHFPTVHAMDKRAVLVVLGSDLPGHEAYADAVRSAIEAEECVIFQPSCPKRFSLLF